MDMAEVPQVGAMVEPARVVVVDDEARSRQQIVRFLADMPSLVVVGEARDGDEALEVVRNLNPDIVLLDIRMPRLDGLKAARTMHREHPDLLIVFLTAHPEFEYAQEAIRVGAADYILKPFRREQVREALRRIVGRHNQRLLEARQRSKQDDVLKSLLPVMRREYLNLLVTWPHAFTEEEAEEKARLLGLRGLPRLVLVARLDSPEETIPAFAAEDAALGSESPSSHPAGRDWGAVLFRFAQGDMLLWREGRRVTAGACPWPNDPADPRRWANLTLERFREACGSGAKVAAGEYTYDARSLPGSYRASLVRLGNRGQRSVSGDRLLALEANLCEAALKGKLSEVAAISREILSGLPLSEAAVEARVLAGLLAATFVRGGLSSDVVARLRGEFEAQLGAGGLRDQERDVFAVVAGFVEELSQRFAESSTAGERAITAARVYVDQNYARGLSLREVASHVFLSPYYFARLFKAHTGLTLGEYLTNTRLARACDLLLQTDHSVAKVADLVGYSSGSYFSALFTRRFGVTPSQYRAGHRGAVP